MALDAETHSFGALQKKSNEWPQREMQWRHKLEPWLCCWTKDLGMPKMAISYIYLSLYIYIEIYNNNYNMFDLIYG